MPDPDRRRLLQGASATAFLQVLGCRPDAPLAFDSGTGTLTTSTGTPGCPDPFAGGTFLGEVPWPDLPDNWGVLEEAGWDARRMFDLRLLAQGVDNASNDLFFVRTAYPDLLTTDERDWTVRIDGLVDTPLDAHIDTIYSQAVDQGQVLIECSGNGLSRGFGLLSAARFTGAPLLSWIEQQVAIDPSATMVRITGFDEHSTPSANGHSTPGASWVFPISALQSRGAFLATQVNDEPLPLDNGFPVRLVVPGCYGCANIKWVTEIALVDDSEPTTGQMSEFATRVHQPGNPPLARDFRVPDMELSAVAVRVEKWRLDGEIAYRVVGILWGGDQLVSGLRLHANDRDFPVTCFQHDDNRTWNLWVHRWTPRQTGSWTLSCTVDEDVAQTRLDSGYYERDILLDEPAG